MCMTFELPNDDEYHMIAYEPIIANKNVMHHILVFGCVDTEGQGTPADLPTLVWKFDSIWN